MSGDERSAVAALPPGPSTGESVLPPRQSFVEENGVALMEFNVQGGGALGLRFRRSES